MTGMDSPHDSLNIMRAQAKAFEKTENGVVITDSSGTILWVNPAFTTLTGYPPDEVLGKNPNILKSGKQPLEFYRTMWNTIVSGQVWQGEVVDRRKDGSLYTEEMIITPFAANDSGITHFIAIKKDISERKKNEKESQLLQTHLHQSEKMAALGQLASGVAHEINNPLGVILGFSQSLLKKIGDQDPLSMPLRSIEREANRCKTLVQNLLVFSRTHKAEKQECDLNVELDKSLSLIEAQTKVKSIELIKELESGLPKILINSNQIQQVIVNLCNNAIDAMPNGGRLTVSSKKAAVNGREAAQIAVQDTGIGMTKETQAKIFEPFFTTKDVGKGTGLGLSLVFEIVQKHFGTIALKSEPGQGTAFMIYLPFGAEAENLSVEKTRILIVDDEPGVLRTIERSLLDMNAAATFASTGFEAGKLVGEKKPNLVILDLFLPGIDGFKICEMIRSDKNLKSTKILAISGHGDKGTKDRALQAGADAFLAKPFDVNVLRERVKALLGIV